MSQKLQGIIIKKHRQDRNWSQGTLCRGICAVSYLSKIEQGKAEGSEEVVDLLFHRLGITWHQEPEFCTEATSWYESCYERLLSGEGVQDLAEDLQMREKKDCTSPFLLDWLILNWAVTGQKPKNIELYRQAMDQRQYNLYLCLTGQFHELLCVSEQGYYFLEAGRRAYWMGDYGRAMEYLQRGYSQASREGSLPIMYECRIFLGNCFSNLNQLEQMQDHYSAACRMARSLRLTEEIPIISYNQATTEIMMGKTEDALRHLLEYPWNEALYFHKLAICYEKLGQTQLALQALDHAQTAPLGNLPKNPPQGKEIFSEMCQVVRFRLEDPDYLQKQEYGALLLRCFQHQESQFPKGFVRFHAIWMEEWYSAHRQYRLACEIIRKFS